MYKYFHYLIHPIVKLIVILALLVGAGCAVKKLYLEDAGINLPTSSAVTVPLP